MNKPVDTERRLVAIFAADVEGYSRLMGADEVGALRDLTQRRTILDGFIASHRGRIANTAGDSVLAEFKSAVDAVQCAVSAQKALAEANTGSARDRHVNFRIGVHVGDVMIKGGDMFGDGINIAARLQTLAAPGGVSVSGVAHDQVRKILPFSFTDLGAQQVKNIEEPVRAYAVSAAKAAPTADALRDLVDRQLPPLPDKASIAVLPFQNMSGDPEQEYFADGIVEDIITALSRFKSLLVSARNTSFSYKGKAMDIKQVGRELGVRYLLEGSVRKGGGRIRITGQLIEAATGAHLWANRFDGAIEDVFELQDKVTEQVVGTIAPMVRQAEIERLKVKRTDNLDAYDTLLRGLAQLQRVTAESTTAALQLFKKAIELDPYYAPAYGRAAYCYVQRNGNGWITDRTSETADALYLARRAVEFGSDDAEVMTDAAVTIGNVGRDLQQFFVINHRAIELNPNRHFAWSLNGWGHIFAGEHDVAIEDFHRAIRLHPTDSSNFASAGMAMAHLLQGRLEEAFAWAERAYGESWNGFAVFRVLAASAALTGRLTRANEIVIKMLAADPTTSIASVERHLRSVLPFQREQDIERQLNGLRLAGLPE